MERLGRYSAGGGRAVGVVKGPRARWWRLSGDARRDAAAIQEAAGLLRRGGLVAFPTETVYGLGADALNPSAVRRIFVAKGRPPDNPLIVHVADPAGIPAGLVAEWPAAARRLGEAFWPGPLTLVVPAGPRVPAAVTAGQPTVAVRCPAHPVARALIAAAATPVAAPSANRSGRPSPTRAQDVWDDLGDAIDGLLDAGPTPVGVESTIVDVTRWPPVLLRPGGVTVEQLEATLGQALQRAAPPRPEEPAAAPGMKYRHYAPEAPLWLLPPPEDGTGPAVEALQRACAAGQRVVVVGCREDLDALAAASHIPIPRVDPLIAEQPAVLPSRPLGLELGPRDRPEEQARRLFRALRAADHAAATLVLALAVPERGLGRTVMNRLRKAAAEGRCAGIGRPEDPGGV